MDEKDGEGSSGGHRDKRLRTTILPEQLDYLYQKYQLESNPSRKMLEQIAAEVGLRKRVVQVWFQNTRARERKGQFRAHQQVINKRCPFCPALFKVRSALESHLATKHADQFSKGEINIDALPDAEGGGGIVVESGEPPPQMPPALPPLAPIPPTSLAPPFLSGPPGSDIGMQSMRRYYEDTMKRYMSDLQGRRSPSPDASMNLAGNLNIRREGQALDLTSPPPGAVAPAPVLDLSRQQQDGGGGDEIPGSSELFERSDDEKSENNLDGRDAIQSCHEFHNLPYETY